MAASATRRWLSASRIGRQPSGEEARRTISAVALFERTGNAVALTAAGRRYFDQIEPAFARIREATEDIKGALIAPACR